MRWIFQKRKQPPKLEELGTVTTLSGQLIILDTGCLNLWSHDKIPVLSDGILETPEATADANSSVDLHLVGSDAEEAGKLLGMSWHPLYVYDQTPDHFELSRKLDEIIRLHKLDARFETISPRIPHLQRTRFAIDYGKGAGEVQFHGIWGVAFESAPIGKPLRVVGERASDTDSTCWKRVVVQLRPELRIASSKKIGCLLVDEARLLIADLESLSAWRHEESLDGKADFVFWGKDAAQVAQQFDATQISLDEYGWLDLLEEVAVEIGTKVEFHVRKNNLKLATDFRPHSHHWQVMKGTRSSPTQSSTIDFNGVKICNFMTTWGDGAFDVYRDLAPSGELAQVRIDFMAE